MDYQTFRTLTKPSEKQRTFYRNNFAEYNYYYVNRPKKQNPLVQIPKTTYNHKVKLNNNHQQTQ